MTANSIILVTVDCLRADHVGFLGYSRSTTPFLDLLACESFVIPNTIVGGVPTYYSLPTLMASRRPLGLGRDVIGLGPGEPSLPSQFKKLGYRTAAFVAANPYISSYFGYDQAFDTFQDFVPEQLSGADGTTNAHLSNGVLAKANTAIARFSARWKPTNAIYNELYFRYCQRVAPNIPSLDSVRPYPHAKIVIDGAEQWLASAPNKPFFLWLHLMDPHAPYYPPAAALEEIGAKVLTPDRARYWNTYWNRSDLSTKRLAGCRATMVELYDASIRWVDMQLASLVAKLKDMKLWERCALVLTADHGEEFLERGGRFHAPGTMKEELIRVPLLARIPGNPGKRLSHEPFGHLDLAPTLLDSLNLPIPEPFQGTSRWPEWLNGNQGERTVVVESTECKNPNQAAARLSARVLCVRGERYKLVLRFSSNSAELFDLHDDPNEQKPLPDDAAKDMRRRLLACAQESMMRSRARGQSEAQLHARLHGLRMKLVEGMSSASAA